MSGTAPKVVTLGETMGLFRSDKAGPMPYARSYSVGVGGAESNVAIGLQRLGCAAAWVGRVGDDELGALVLHELRAEGVVVRAVSDPGAPTGLMIKSRRTPATQQVFYYRSMSAGAGLRPADLPVDLIERAQVLHLTGITPALSDSAAATVDAAIGIASASETKISFDINYRSRLWSSSRAATVLARLVSQADVVFAGMDESALVVGTRPTSIESAHALVELGPTQAIVKMGAAGCVAVINGQEFVQRGVSIEPVDTVGAGDAFVAGYLADLISGLSPPERLSTAVRAGAFACLVDGDWEGAPHRRDLQLLEASENVSR